MSQFDPYDSIPSAAIPAGGTMKWTQNGQAPAPSFMFLNYVDWLIQNYEGSKSSFTDAEFDVHNTVDTANKVTLKFDLNPATSGDVGIHTKYLSVPRLATEPPVPYHDEIVTKYATQDLYNKRFVGAVYGIEATVPASPGNNTVSGGYFYGVCLGDFNVVRSSTINGGGYAGVILPKATQPGAFTRIINFTNSTCRVVPFLADTLTADYGANAGQGPTTTNYPYPYQQSPAVQVRPLYIGPGASREFMCESYNSGSGTGVWKDVSNGLWNNPDKDPHMSGTSDKSNIIIVDSEGALLDGRMRFAGGAGTGTNPYSYAYIADQFFWIGKAGSSGSSDARFTGIRFDVTTLRASSSGTTIQVPDSPNPFGTPQMVLDDSSQTLSAKALDDTCTYGGPITKSNIKSTGATVGHVLTATSGNNSDWLAPSPGIFGTKNNNLTAADDSTDPVNTVLNAINIFTTVSGGAQNWAILPGADVGDCIIIVNSMGLSTGGLYVSPGAGNSITTDYTQPIGDFLVVLLMKTSSTTWKIINESV